MKHMAALLIFAVSVAPAMAEQFSAAPGKYKIEDGMTIVLAGERISLRHISAPPMGTRCILRGKPRDCGLISRSSLMDLSAGAVITCRRDDDGLGRCTAGGFDLAENMVYTGWAVPAAGAPSGYWKQMAGAKSRKRGFWNGHFAPGWAPQQAALKR
ncbi:MAG: thermonuclease family protein [Rhizobiales bacterium]|nr:thermonuclease family protein [Hyphomicrobiales bacterium]